MSDTWQDTAKQAWAACDDRKLTRDEKIALVAEAITVQYLEKDGYRSSDIEWLASRSPLNTRQFAAVCRNHLNKVSAHLGGLELSYSKGGYSASGRGDFGRLGGGHHGAVIKPCLTIG